MKFQKGHKKVPGSGRRKGQTCRLAADVRAKLQEMGCDPIEGMAILSMDESVEVAIRASCFKELAQYCYPKRRAVEISGLDGSPIEHKYNSSALESLEIRIAGIASRVGTVTTTQ